MRRRLTSLIVATLAFATLATAETTRTLRAELPWTNITSSPVPAPMQSTATMVFIPGHFHLRRELRFTLFRYVSFSAVKMMPS